MNKNPVSNPSDNPAESLAWKLQIRDGMRGQVSGVPENVDLCDLPQAETGDDFVVVFVRSAADLDQLAGKVVRSVRADGLVWFCYPKKSSNIKTDITRDQGWQVLRTLGYRPVRQVAIDANWSALRFREEGRVGKPVSRNRTE